MISAESLKKEYFDWLLNEEIFRDAGTSDRPVVEIDTPFLDDDFDDIILYAYQSKNQKIMLTDNGWTLDNLSSHGVTFDKRSTARNKILSEILANYGISKDTGSKKLYINAFRRDFPAVKQRLLQGILKIVDINYLSKENVMNSFSDEVAKIFDKHDILYSQSKAVIGRNGLSFIFDFIIPTKNRNSCDKLIRTFANPKFINSAKIFSWDASRINSFSSGRNSSFFAIINDSDERGKHLNNFADILNENETNKSVIKSIAYSTIEDNIALLKN
ncbi:MAG: DUF1828 domain-containing protein [Lentilactobacillus diolivorans]|jgi:hypothetical protein|nr:DUF1828 domain-containing protein [Lentilactobacillus diolivorans]